MIGRHPREGCAVNIQTDWLESGIHENVIDGESGKKSRESPEGTCRPNQPAHIAQTTAKSPVRA